MNRPWALEHNDQGRFGTDARPVYANNHDVRNAHHSSVAGWKSQSEYNGPGDFVFPSRCHKGKKPLDLAAVLKTEDPTRFCEGWDHRRGLAHVSALLRARDSRNTYSTLLQSVGTEFNVMQEPLRHSSLRSTLDVYAQAILPAKHAAQAAVLALVYLLKRTLRPSRKLGTV
jgi:hypothetical protein